ncbi:hypothetical protein [Tsuneonella sp. HG222]
MVERRIFEPGAWAHQSAGSLGQQTGRVCATGHICIPLVQIDGGVGAMPIPPSFVGMIG